jgi:hypothetical protein
MTVHRRRPPFVSLLLATIALNASAAEQVVDGSFEEASEAWTFTDAVRCSNAFCLPPTADGSFWASNAFGFDLVPPMVLSQPIGRFEQAVRVPESPAVLEFSVRRVDAESPTGAYLWVTLDGALLRQIDSDASVAFESVSIDLSEDQIDPDLRLLRFEVFCSNEAPFPAECDRFDVDGVSLRTPEPEVSAIGFAAIGSLLLLRRARTLRRAVESS